LARWSKHLLRLGRLLVPLRFTKRATKRFEFSDFFTYGSSGENVLVYVDSSRQSARRSETEDSLNCLGEFAIRFPGRDRIDSQAGSGPIPQIFPTRDTATNTGLSTSVTQRVFEKSFLGSTGDSPVPSGDSPDGTAATIRTNRGGLLVVLTSAGPIGGSPTVAGEPPALPISKTRSETTDAIGNQDGLIRLCGGAKAGSISPADWIEEIKTVWARGPASTLELARVMCAVRDLMPRGGWTALWKSGDMPFAAAKHIICWG